MKYPKKNGKTLDVVFVGQKQFFLKDAQDNLESRIESELRPSRKEADAAIVEHREATPNFMDSLDEKAAEMSVYEDFQKAENYLGGNRTEGEELRYSLNEMTMPYAKELAIENQVSSLDEEKGSEVLDKVFPKQDMIDKTDMDINREVTQNRNIAETLRKDSPVLYGKALERGDMEEASRLQEQHIRETINLADQTAKKRSEEANEMRMKNPKIYEELSSFGIKRFPKLRRKE